MGCAPPSWSKVAGVVAACAARRRRAGCRGGAGQRAGLPSVAARAEQDAREALPGPEASAEEYLSLFCGLPERPELAEHVAGLLETYLQRGFSAEEGCDAALRGTLSAGARREVARVFEVRCALPEPPPLQRELLSEMLRVLSEGALGGRQLDAALEQLQGGALAVSAASLFDAMLEALLSRPGAGALFVAERLLRAMRAAEVPVGEETLTLILEHHILAAAPGFLVAAGRTLLIAAREHRTRAGPWSMLALSAGHLRSGNVDAAYYWFLASQLVEHRAVLGDDLKPRVAEHLSQLARALALSGQVCRLLHLLARLRADGGRLLPSAGAQSIAGLTSGRTLATVWLEPPAEALRRRGVWASGGEDGVRVACAEQFEWGRLEAERHEVHQWSPYPAPDARPERVWLTPLRAPDCGHLGLARDWLGESAAAAAARERLGERAPQVAAELRQASLDRAARAEPASRTAGGAVDGLGAFVFPPARSWRAHHADAVKRAFLTGARVSAGSSEELRDIVATNAFTKGMVQKTRAPCPIAPARISASGEGGSRGVAAPVGRNARG
ncbi:unnamed protein product [Prorocentrum cordatum]|uniref:Uncharacterized protein n=2 Tax=Prorocentrum cordatum TaxID=2364126 RepID=A0ABN9U4Y9_9DINO|nr:unnamed protein product [Polarella glacialis]